ncbi:hypothetical protein PENSTE_c002G02953 [Penicillium steckii]|uniref:Uncharacterized protein n=1 Tax=Penicillium steckii TaxID=303698 RepID=A0A1V6TUF3_9EURO|nr:hypothetical protein PENSTE_c002G02953 [Penicillium steckii]
MAAKALPGEWRIAGDDYRVNSILRLDQIGDRRGQARPGEAHLITAYLQGDPPKPGDDLTSEMVGETLPDMLQMKKKSGLVVHASDLLASCKHSIFHRQLSFADGKHPHHSATVPAIVTGLKVPASA